jgi:hypothetical protein
MRIENPGAPPINYGLSVRFRSHSLWGGVNGLARKDNTMTKIEREAGIITRSTIMPNGKRLGDCTSADFGKFIIGDMIKLHDDLGFWFALDDALKAKKRKKAAQKKTAAKRTKPAKVDRPRLLRQNGSLMRTRIEIPGAVTIR